MPDKPTIQVEKIYIRSDRSGGAVTYEITHPDGHFSYMRQPFRRGGYDNGQWGWDGREPLTLRPSFDCRDDREGIRAHLHLTSGEIELCGDSTVGVDSA